MHLSPRPLIIFHCCAFLHRRVVWDCIRTFGVQVGQDELSHSRVQLPDARGHNSNRKGSFVVGCNLLFSLFLRKVSIS